MSTFCGTGSGNFPQPGDPDLNGVIITAAPAFGGIDISWSYPGLNPHAVSYFILYRSTSADPVTRGEHRVVTGDFYYDKSTSDSSVEYFYWIQMVSVNGTYGDIVGPASAIARPTIENVIIGLTGKIDTSQLAIGLKSSIGEIDTTKQALYNEQVARAASDDSLGVAFSQVLAQSDETRALLQEEINARATADSALVSEVNTLAVQVGDGTAAIQQELSAFATQVNGDLTEIGAKFSIKTDVNGLVGGFGVYNDGATVEMGFDVDTFWVGRTDTADGIAKGTKPFIISGNEVFIKEAVIQSLTFNKLRSDDGSLAFTPAVYDGLGVLVTPGKLRVDYIDAANLAVQYANIQNVVIQNADIANSSVSNAKIANGAITNVKIGNAQITTAKIGTAQVGTLQIASQSVVFPRGSRQDASIAVGNASWVNLAYVDIAPTSGASVVLIGSAAWYGSGQSFGRYMQYRLLRGGTIESGPTTVGSTKTVENPGDSFPTHAGEGHATLTAYIGNPGTTTQRFTLQGLASNGSGFSCSGRTLTYIEGKR